MAEMSFRKRTVPLALSAAILLAPLALAEGLAAQERLTIEKAVETALTRNPDVVAARHAVEAAEGRRLQAEARPDPQLSLSTEGVPYSLNKSDVTEVNLGFEQPFEFPGKRPLRARIGRYEADIAVLELERVRLAVSARVKRAYWKAALAERAVSSLEGMTGLVDEIIEASRIRYQAGSAAYADVLRARVEKARLQNDIIGARRERDASRSALALLIGGRPGEIAALATELAFAPFDRTLEEVREAARATRPSLKIAALLAERASAEVRLAALNRRPDFTLAVFLPSVRFNAWGVGIGLSLPVSKSRTEGRRLEAAASQAASRTSAEARARELDSLLETAYAAVRAAESQVRLFEETLLSEMEEEMRIGLSDYRYGRIEALALLDLYRTSVTTKLERLSALHLYLSGLADLEAAGEED